MKEFIDIREYVSLDELIGKLVEIRDSLPQDSEAELRLRGDDVFGRKMTISYLRELTDEEAEMESRYADAAREAKQLELERLQQELGVAHYSACTNRAQLRIAA